MAYQPATVAENRTVEQLPQLPPASSLDATDPFLRLAPAGTMFRNVLAVQTAPPVTPHVPAATLWPAQRYSRQDGSERLVPELEVPAMLYVPPPQARCISTMSPGTTPLLT